MRLESRRRSRLSPYGVDSPRALADSRPGDPTVIDDHPRTASLRVAFVVPGGVSRDEPRHVIPSIAWLVERLAIRHRVTVLALYQDDVLSEYRWRGATVHTLAATHKGEYASRKTRFAPPGFDLLRSLVRARAILKDAGGVDVVHGMWGSASGLLAVLLGRLFGVPSLVSLYGGELVGLPDVGYGAQLSRRDRWQVALTLRLADRVTGPTYFMRTLATLLGANVEVVPLGVDARALGNTPLDSTPTLTLPEGPPWRLLYVGNLNRVKDPFTLLEAIARLRGSGIDVRLELAGADHLAGAAQRSAIDLGLGEHVAFLGHVDHRALVAIYAGSHLLVIPSRHEAGPVVALEAAILGVPIVGSAVGHVADWAPEAATAVPPGDPDALAEAIAALLDDPERRAATAESARQWVSSRDADWSSSEFERIYRELIALSTPPRWKCREVGAPRHRTRRRR